VRKQGKPVNPSPPARSRGFAMARRRLVSRASPARSCPEVVVAGLSGPAHLASCGPSGRPPRRWSWSRYRIGWRPRRPVRVAPGGPPRRRRAGLSGTREVGEAPRRRPRRTSGGEHQGGGRRHGGDPRDAGDTPATQLSLARRAPLASFSGVVGQCALWSRGQPVWKQCRSAKYSGPGDAAAVISTNVGECPGISVDGGLRRALARDARTCWSARQTGDSRILSASHDTLRHRTSSARCAPTGGRFACTVAP